MPHGNNSRNRNLPPLGTTFDGYLSCVPLFQCDVCKEPFHCGCEGFFTQSPSPLVCCPNHSDTTQHENCLEKLKYGLRELCIQHDQEECFYDNKTYDGRFGSFREPLSKPNLQSLAFSYVEKMKVFSIFDNCQIPYLRHTLIKLSPSCLRLFASYRCVDTILSIDKHKSQQNDFLWLIEQSLDHLEAMIVNHPSRLNLNNDPDFANKDIDELDD